MPTVFFTGFPGFLGSELLPRVLSRSPAEVSATCLIEPRFMPLARQRVESLARDVPATEGRIRLVEGDLTAPDLGLGSAGTLSDETTEIFHLAAVYDLAVERTLAMRVNVEGTHHLLDFAASCPRLARLHYVSTCYVSGGHVGAFTERDLEKGQSFRNFYEESKYLAEVDVQRRMKDGLPATIYRPAIVAGDSATGATQKYDGAYYIARLLLKQPRALSVLPVPGDPTRARFNVVPRDFVVDAIAHLAGLPSSVGKVYQLCDPDALSVAELFDTLASAAGHRLVKVPLPRSAKGALARVPKVMNAFAAAPPQSLDYLDHPTYYTCENTLADLAGSGIRCPSFREYADRVIAFVRSNPQLGTPP